MVKKISVVVSVLLFSMSLHADDIGSPEVLQSLQEDMKEYTRIATKTRQNVDYMPYIISAWDSEELNQLGISTLREALRLVPGVDLSIGTVGATIPVFRGSNPFAMGQSKLIIDGVVVNDKMTGGYNQFMDMPVDMIKRIEVVRGPGSLLNYVNAYAGSIHVITKANSDDGLPIANEVFAELGSSQYKSGGFVTSHQQDSFSVSSDFFYKRHDQVLPVAMDRYGSSGDSQQWLRNYSLGINAHYNNFSIKSRLSEREGGASYGQSFSLSEDESDYITKENNYIEFGYSYDISAGVTTEISLGYNELTRLLQNKVIPDGVVVGINEFPNGKYFLVDIQEQTLYQRIELQVAAIDSHHINLGFYTYQSDMAKKEGRESFDDMQTFTVYDILKDEPRKMYSLYAEDIIDLTEQTSVQMGLKYDHYSDVENQVSPRIALVYRYDDKNIYKFMYTHSYREPSWREQYLTTMAFYSSTLDIKPESVDAYELGYIHKIDIKSHIKANAYYLINKDQIHAQNQARLFQNSGDNNLYGFELEYKKLFKNNDQFYVNYSYVEGGNVSNETLASIAESMVKAYYIHVVNDALSLSAVVSIVGNKNRIDEDLRSPVDSYAVADLSINYQFLPEDVSVNLSVKNIFDKTHHLPSPDDTYPDDFEQEGRSVLFGLRMGF